MGDLTVGVGGSWFAVVPDGPAGAAAATRLRQHFPDRLSVVSHPSGSPFLLGRWAPEELTVISAGPLCVVVLGRCSAGAGRLSAALAHTRDLKDLDAVLDVLPGCFHMAASLGGRVRVQGTVSAVRQVFHTQIEGTTVAACRADVLARLSGAALDERLLAARLLVLPPPHPLDTRCPWRGVYLVPADSFLVLNTDGTARPVQWWRPPDPLLPLKLGVAGVRQALAEAVAARTAAGGVVSADLSGGMDSSSICFLAARGPARLITYRQGTRDPGNDDARFGALAAAALQEAEHTVEAPEQIPPMFALPPLLSAGDEPYRWIRSQARAAHTAHRMASRGSRLHLSGHGGDELFLAAPSHLHTLVRTRPWASVGALRARRALSRWPVSRTLRALADSADYATWLAATARSLVNPSPVTSAPQLQWGAPPRMPPWASDQAVHAVRELLTEAAADDVAPLHALRAQHEALHHVRVCGRAARQADRLMSMAGVPLEVPFLDRRVVEAALAIRLEDRGTARRYKPPLAAAMHGVVPDLLLLRTTKGGYGDDVYRGLHDQRTTLLDLFESAELSRLGLIKPQALRAALLAPHATARTLIPLESTLACEGWLQNLPDTTP